MGQCLCGHAAFLHTDGVGCLRFFLGCHCDAYEADTGGDGPHHFTGPRHDSDPYRGIYGTDRKFQR
jgi:hypothetical protein